MVAMNEIRIHLDFARAAVLVYGINVINERT